MPMAGKKGGVHLPPAADVDLSPSPAEVRLFFETLRDAGVAVSQSGSRVDCQVTICQRPPRLA
jgi:hypothetical protein